MQNLETDRGFCKANASLSNSAKLLAALMKATGVFEAKAISEAHGIPLRTVQRLKLEIACANDATRGAYSEYGESATSANSATDGADQGAKCAMDGVSEAPNTPPVAPRARVEENNLLTNLGTTVGSEDSPPTPSHVTPVTDWRSAFGADDQDHGVDFSQGRLTLVNGTRAFWLEQFGGDETALNLALIEAAGSLQRNSNAGLKVQVERKLANIVRDTRDRDKRYERVAGSKAAKGAAPANGGLRALLNKGKAEVRV